MNPYLILAAILTPFAAIGLAVFVAWTRPDIHVELYRMRDKQRQDRHLIPSPVLEER
jgi:hypothetical protein